MAQIQIAAGKVKAIRPDVIITGVTYSGGVTITGTHAYEVGDIVQISGVTGAVESNGQWIVSAVTGTTSFKINSPSISVTSYVSGGTSKHLGFSAFAVTDNVAINEVTDSCTLKVQLSSLSPGASVRFVAFDSYDAGPGDEPLVSFNTAGATHPSGDELWSIRLYQVPDWRLGSPGNVTRINALVIGGGPGTSFTFSSWIDGV